MRDIYINSNLDPFTKFSFSSNLSHIQIIGKHGNRSERNNWNPLKYKVPTNIYLKRMSNNTFKKEKEKKTELKITKM